MNLTRFRGKRFPWRGTTHHVLAKCFQQELEEVDRGEERGLVELLLAQLVVVVHGLHEAAEAVDGRVSDQHIVQLQRSEHHRAEPFAEPAGTTSRLIDGQATFEFTLAQR